jgi:DNA segregation ATPase FtsK/SpoIIIE-like protein
MDLLCYGISVMDYLVGNDYRIDDYRIAVPGRAFATEQALAVPFCPASTAAWVCVRASVTCFSCSVAFEFVRTDIAQQIENLYEGAKTAVVESGHASASYLQRTLKIGHATACMFMDRLEDDGIIGEAEGWATPREVLVKSVKDLEKESPSIFGEELDEDQLYGEAESLARSAGKVSTAFLQRRLGIGYAISENVVSHTMVKAGGSFCSSRSAMLLRRSSFRSTMRTRKGKSLYASGVKPWRTASPPRR